MLTMLAKTNTEGFQSIRWVLVIFTVILVFLAVWFVRDIMMLTLSAIILAILLTSPVRLFVRMGAKRPFAVLLTLVLLLAVLGITMAILLPTLLDQLGKLLITIQNFLANLQESLKNPDSLKVTYPFLQDLDLKSIADQIRQQIPTNIPNLFPFVGGLANTVGGFASTILSILIVLFLALYFVADPNTHVNGIVTLTPLNLRNRAREILVALDLTLRRYLQGQIILMLFTGLTTGIELALFGIPLAAVLGTIAGIFSFVPTFGPLITLIPILTVALGTPGIQPGTTTAVIVIFFVLQFIQSQIVTPVLMGQEVNLPPAIILLSQIIAGVFFGFLGLLLSVPLAAIIVVLVREIYVKDILGDTVAAPEKSPAPTPSVDRETSTA